ncbi:MAG: hypothetical protein HFE78_00755 [Clostridiales bacterium]|nr:hypothetical protein [Clostridiales bacterium]
MEKEFNRDIDEMVEEIGKLPYKEQQAIGWLINNFDLVEEICKDSALTMQEIEQHKKIAAEKEDYVTLALLCAAEVYKNKRSGGSDSSNRA